MTIPRTMNPDAEKVFLVDAPDSLYLQQRISPSGLTKVAEGSSMVYTFAPANGYIISAVAVDGKQLGAISSYSFSNIASNHSIAVAFSPKPTDTGKINKNTQTEEPGKSAKPTPLPIVKNDEEGHMTNEPVEYDNRQEEADIINEETNVVPEMTGNDAAVNVNIFDNTDLQTRDDKEIARIAQKDNVNIGKYFEIVMMKTHQGKDGNLTVSFLQDLDDDPTTITIETDQFSSYAIGYIGGDEGTFTKKNVVISLMIMVVIAIIATVVCGITISVKHRRRRKR